MKEKNNTLKKSILYNSIGTFCYLFFQWLITFIIVWISGYEDAGKFSIVMSISSTFYAISAFGMRNFQASDVKGEYSEKSYITSRIITCFISLICTFIYSLTLGYDMYLVLCINTYMIFKTSEAIIDVIHGSLQKKWLYKEIGISFLVRGILSIVTFTFTLFLFRNLLLSIIFMSIAVYLEVFFYDFNNYKNNFKKLGITDRNKIISLLINSLPLCIVTFLSNYLVTYPRIQIESILGAKILGIYTTFANPALIIQVAASFIFTPLITLFANLYKNADNKGLYKVLVKTICFTLFIGGFGYLCAHLFGKQIMTTLFGKSIVKYNYLLCQIIIVSTLTALTWLLNSVVTVFRKQWVLILGTGLSLIVMIIFSKDVVINYGLSGVNYLLMICYLITIVILLVFIIYTLNNKKVGGKK